METINLGLNMLNFRCLLANSLNILIRSWVWSLRDVQAASIPSIFGILSWQPSQIQRDYQSVPLVEVLAHQVSYLGYFLWLLDGGQEMLDLCCLCCWVGEKVGGWGSNTHFCSFYQISLLFQVPVGCLLHYFQRLKLYLVKRSRKKLSGPDWSPNPIIY